MCKVNPSFHIHISTHPFIQPTHTHQSPLYITYRWTTPSSPRWRPAWSCPPSSAARRYGKATRRSSDRGVGGIPMVDWTSEGGKKEKDALKTPTTNPTPQHPPPHTINSCLWKWTWGGRSGASPSSRRRPSSPTSPRSSPAARGASARRGSCCRRMPWYVRMVGRLKG